MGRVIALGSTTTNTNIETTCRELTLMALI